MLKVDNIHVYYGEAEALRGVSLNVERGEMIAIVGANGAGKTTTLRTIAGLIKPRKGVIELDGERIDKLPPYEIVKRGVALVPEGRGIFPEMTVWENLLLGAYTRKDRNEIMDNLKRVYELFPKLEERKKQLAGTLSGGEQQMLAIGRALMLNPKILMLDEPSLGLAPTLVQKIFEVLQLIHKQGTTILLVEQNVHWALNASDRAYVLENGRIVLEGNSRELLNSKYVKQAYLGI
jgi:branched-chain amino acid transport system ATP-binding protein